MTLIATYVVSDGHVRLRHNFIPYGRQRILHKLRQRIARRLRDAGASYPAIGAALGGRHHTTVMYMLGLIKRRREGRA